MRRGIGVVWRLVHAPIVVCGALVVKGWVHSLVMVHPPISRVRVRIFGESDDSSSTGARARSVARAVCDGSFVAAARVIKADGRTSVFAGEAAGYPVVVKTLALDRVRDRIGSWIGRTRLWRQARGSERVRSCAVPSALTYALVRGVDGSGHRVEALILERVEGPTLLRAASDRSLDPARARILLDRVGQGVGTLHRSGLYNRDHKPSNLIVSACDAGDPLPVLIDTADIRAREPSDALERMLAKLLIEATGTGVSVHAREQVRVARAALASSGQDRDLDDLLRAVRAIVAAHGDPTPKDDPLAFDE